MSSSDNYEYSALLESFRGAQKQYRSGNADFAEPIFWGALSKLNESSTELAECLLHLAQITSNRGDYNEAIRLYLRLLSVRAAVEDNGSVAKAMEKIAQLYEVTGRLNEAEYMGTRARYLRDRMSGGTMPAPDAVESDPTVGAPEQSMEGCLGSPPDWLKNAFTEAARVYGPKKQALESHLEDAEGWDKGGTSRPSNDYKKWSGTEPQPHPGYSGAGHRSNQGQKPANPEEEFLPKVFAKKRKEPKSDDSSYNFVPPPVRHAPQEQTRRPPPPRNLEPAPGREATRSPDAPAPSVRRPSSGGNREQSSGTGNFTSSMKGGSPPSSKSGNIIDGLMLPSSVMRVAMRNLQSFEAIGAAVAKGVGGQPQFMGGLVVIIIAYTLCILGALIIMPKQKTEITTKIADKYRCADDDKGFELIDGRTCEIRVGNDDTRARYKRYKGDIADGIALALGALSEKQYMLHRRGYALKDPDGTYLYLQNSPEVDVLNHLDVIQGIANLYYQKDGAYPSAFSAEDATKLAYKNPFTNGTDHPALQHEEIDKTSSSKDADIERTSIYSRLFAGQSWPERPALTPFSLDCCSIVIKSERGNFNAFICQPTDAYGRVFTSSLPHTKFFLALEDGKIHNPPARAKLKIDGSSIFRPAVVYLIDPNLDDGAVDLLRHGCIYFFGVAAVLMFIGMHFVYLDKTAKGLVWFAIAVAVVMAVVFMVGSLA